MRRCRHELSWNPEWSCDRRGWLAGLCVEHVLHRLRWSGESKREFYWSVDLSNMNRPHLQIDEEHQPIEYVALSWGNGNSDPVWTIGWQKRREVTPLTRCEVCDETLDESIGEHLEARHPNEFFTIDYDPASGLGVITEMAP